MHLALLMRGGGDPHCILDFGAGNGELCKLIALQFPKAKIVCYEPTPSLMAEAKENLADLPQISFCSDLEKISDGSVELIFCLEVFEHLPEKETKDALGQFDRLLTDNGNAVIGVPVEIGIPALYKGIFRMSRRFNTFDASIKNVL
ncbi:class I SAM-dependent methyltransferase [Nitrosomonas europaea]|uniref:class I SAM-dependent methyltransferase n=1 Tax=Nitrosomonas europaea TaxID=915 RepID=UPI0032661A7F